ncbi:hypothetical protein THIAE_10410 [Thiomicrospira aerophila AL3]|uniref:SsuA/THI5-like domain-containing protein n=2 Tax=Thiomicrospira aerophila TaxID=92245 RepID=W0DZJ0_9GAMM|nr:hypothetical protein THIAE_10410 [Thiomicrospira aerophila AL3]
MIDLANKLNIIDRNKIDLVKTSSASETMSRFQNKQLDVAMLTFDEAIRLCANGTELEIILIFNISMGADIVLSRPTINELAQIKGKRIGLEFNSVGKIILAELLRRTNLSSADVELVNVEHHLQPDAWINQQLDLLITYEPQASKLLIQSPGIKLFSSLAIPDRIFDVMVIQKDLSRQQIRLVRQLVKDYFQATFQFKSNPINASYHLAEILELHPEEILKLYRLIQIPDQLANHRFLSGQDPRLIQNLDFLSSLNAQLNLENCDQMHLFNDRYIGLEI